MLGMLGILGMSATVGTQAARLPGFQVHVQDVRLLLMR